MYNYRNNREEKGMNKIKDYDVKKAFPGCKIEEKNEGLHVIVNPKKLTNILVTDETTIEEADTYEVITSHKIIVKFNSEYDTNKHVIWTWLNNLENELFKILKGYVFKFDGVVSFVIDREKMIDVKKDLQKYFD